MKHVRDTIRRHPNWTARQIADACDVSASSVHNYAKRAGIKLPRARSSDDPDEPAITVKPVAFTSSPVYGRSTSNSGYVKLV